MNLDEANEKFKSELTELFKPLAGKVLPSATVESIHSHGFTEDGKTLHVMLTLADGHTVLIAVCPGHPISCIQVD